jgi:drug/metabolite transporter (DMT)-like permease
MFSWLPLVFIGVAALVQAVVIVLSRKYGIAFLMLVPLVIVHQYFFLTAYTKAENFTLIWFFVAALTSVVALIIGHFIFHDVVSWQNYVGIALIVIGVTLTKL